MAGVVTIDCPSCGSSVTAKPYDIGSGPELNCPRCDACFGVNGQRLDPTDPMRSMTSREECLQLLEEWFSWWKDSDAPAKLPRALQVRTGIVLHMSGRRPGAQFEKART